MAFDGYPYDTAPPLPCRVISPQLVLLRTRP
jgi:hypothetical protein